jgi:hypothetical protein
VPVPVPSVKQNPLTFVSGRTRWLLSLGRVNAEFVRLLVWPATLCIEYRATTAHAPPSVAPSVAPS